MELKFLDQWMYSWTVALWNFCLCICSDLAVPLPGIYPESIPTPIKTMYVCIYTYMHCFYWRRYNFIVCICVYICMCVYIPIFFFYIHTHTYMLIHYAIILQTTYKPYILVFDWCTRSCHKFSSLKPHSFITSQVCRSEFLLGMAGFYAQGTTKLKWRCWLYWVLI